MTAASPKNWYADKAPPNFNIHWTKIAHEFKDKALERRVFTAPGYGKGQAGAASAPDNELLEWLGDAILKKAQTLALFRLGTQKYGDQTEGGLTVCFARRRRRRTFGAGHGVVLTGGGGLW